ncbi:hypothetical protein MJM45_33250, partial [Salmonella enterica subsp. enterica serovar Kentucky]|nr:hypothetical protein [Salmonella enterica subsp. enterica serovar Kentucky]
MRAILRGLLPATLLPLAAYAQEATIKEVHDAPAVRGSIVNFCGMAASLYPQVAIRQTVIPITLSHFIRQRYCFAISS